MRYLIVDGVAAVLHGHLRTTADLDLWVELTEDNLTRALECFRKLGFRPRAPVVFSLWRPGNPLELHIFVRDPFDFADASRRALLVPLETTEARVIGLDDLIVMKEGAGRHRDREDVTALRALGGTADEDPR